MNSASNACAFSFRRMRSSMSHNSWFTALSAARSAAMPVADAGFCAQVAFSRSSSARTFASLAGSRISAVLISRMVILSINSPNETGTEIRLMCGRLAWRAATGADCTRMRGFCAAGACCDLLPVPRRSGRIGPGLALPLPLPSIQDLSMPALQRAFAKLFLIAAAGLLALPAATYWFTAYGEAGLTRELNSAVDAHTPAGAPQSTPPPMTVAALCDGAYPQYARLRATVCEPGGEIWQFRTVRSATLYTMLLGAATLLLTLALAL